MASTTLAVADIDLPRTHVTSLPDQLFSSKPQVAFVHIRHHDSHAFSHEGFRDRQADPARRTSNHRNALTQLPHGPIVTALPGMHHTRGTPPRLRVSLPRSRPSG